MLACLTPVFVTGTLVPDSNASSESNPFDPLLSINQEKEKITEALSKPRCSNLLSRYHQGDLVDGLCFTCRAVENLKSRKNPNGIDRLVSSVINKNPNE